MWTCAIELDYVAQDSNTKSNSFKCIKEVLSKEECQKFVSTGEWILIVLSVSLGACFLYCVYTCLSSRPSSSSHGPNTPLLEHQPEENKMESNSKRNLQGEGDNRQEITTDIINPEELEYFKGPDKIFEYHIKVKDNNVKRNPEKKVNGAETNTKKGGALNKIVFPRPFCI
jgi:hypothetical protein